MALFGTSTFGIPPYGGSADFDVVSAYAANLQTVRITFSLPPKSFNDSDPDDATNPGLVVLSIASARKSARPVPETIGILAVPGAPESIDIRLSSDLDTSAVTYLVTVSPDVASVSGAPIGVRTALFRGVAAPVVPAEEVDGELTSRALVDFRNVPWNGVSYTGEGDIALSVGEETLRKRLWRILTTQKGEFLRAPGLGVPYALSSPLRPRSVAQVAEDVRRSLLREPELREVSVSVDHAVGRGVLTIRVEAYVKGGQTISMRAEVTV